MALWRGLLVHFGFKKRPLCRPRDPLGVPWTPQGVHFGYSRVTFGSKIVPQRPQNKSLSLKSLKISQIFPDRRHARKGLKSAAPGLPGCQACSRLSSQCWPVLALARATGSAADPSHCNNSQMCKTPFCVSLQRFPTSAYKVSNVSLHMLCYFCLFGLCLALFSVF